MIRFGDEYEEEATKLRELVHLAERRFEAEGLFLKCVANVGTESAPAFFEWDPASGLIRMLYKTEQETLPLGIEAILTKQPSVFDHGGTKVSTVVELIPAAIEALWDEGRARRDSAREVTAQSRKKLENWLMSQSLGE